MKSAVANRIKNDKYEFISFNGSQWIKIFYHNYKNREDFENEADALNSNTETKYSIIGEATRFKRYNGKYEFILYYPYKPNDYNQWKQTLFPLYDLDSYSKSTALGFSPVHLSFTNSFGGLVKNNEETAVNGIVSNLFDGTVGSEIWHYCIAKYKENDSWKNLNIPGPVEAVTELYLFMKAFDYNNMLLHTCFQKIIISQSSLYSFIGILFILYS